MKPKTLLDKIKAEESRREAPIKVVAGALLEAVKLLKMASEMLERGGCGCEFEETGHSGENGVEQIEKVEACRWHEDFEIFLGHPK